MPPALYPALHLVPEALLDLERHVLGSPRREQCGFLIGHRGAPAGAVVRRALPAENIAVDPGSFAISPREHDQLIARLPPGEDLVGIYHSHLGAPDPSPADLASMRLLPLVWLIVGNVQRAERRALTYTAFVTARAPARGAT